MSTRKYEYGHLKLKIKREVDIVIKSQKGPLDKFLENLIKLKQKRIAECPLEEILTNLVEIVTSRKLK